MSREQSGLAGPKAKVWQDDGRPEGAGTTTDLQEHTHQVMPHLEYHELLKRQGKSPQSLPHKLFP